MNRADRPAFAIPNAIANKQRVTSAQAFAVRDRLRASAAALDPRPVNWAGVVRKADDPPPGNPEATPECSAYDGDWHSDKTDTDCVDPDWWNKP